MPDEAPPTPSPPSQTSPTVPSPAAPSAEPANFADQISAEYREGVAKFKTPDALAQGYLELETKLGSADRIEFPSDESPPETWDAFHERLGRPATPADYTVPTIPDDFTFKELPQAELESFQKLAHEIGLNDKQFSRAVEWYTATTNDTINNTTKSLQDAVVDAEATLKKEWGEAFDQNLAQADDAISTFDNEDEFKQLLVETGLQNEPRMARFLQRVGRNLAEDAFHRGPHGPNTFTSTPTEAIAKIAEISSDEAFIKTFLDAHDPGNEAAKKRWHDLHQLAYPDEPVPTP